MDKHVLLIVDSYVTERDPRRGAKFRLHLRSYSRRGWHVGLVAIQQRDRSVWPALVRGGLIEEREFGIPVLRDCVPYGLLGRPIGSGASRLGTWLSNRAIAMYVRRHGRPDLLHAHGSQWSGVAALAASRRWGLPYILTEHMTIYSRGAVDRDLLPTMHEVFESARIRLPISSQVGAVLEGVFGEAVQPWIAVPNMVDVDLFYPADPARSRRQDRFTLLSVSALVPKKGFDILLRAFQQAFGGGEERLRIGGDGPERANLERLAMELDIPGQVEFLGELSRERVAEEMRSAWAYVLASRHETFGIPVVEAHAVGLPVVSTRCGGPEDLVDSSSGVLVAPDDVDALASALRTMRDTVDDYDPVEIRRACLARVSPDAVLDRLEGIYETAITDGAPSDLGGGD